MKTKVLQFICPTGYYGAERWITALVKSLDQNQFESHLCITLEDDSATDIVSHCDNYCEKIHTIGMKSKFDPSVVSKLVRILKDHDIDVIHTHGYKSDIIGIIAGKLAGVKTVCTPHGFENTTEFKLRTYMWLGGKTFNHFDVVCPLSPQIELDLLNIYGVKPAKIQLINNGVDLSEVVQAIDGLASVHNNAPFTIGYIGQLISRKNITSMLEAFSYFLLKHPTAQLVLIGDGEERHRLEDLADQLGIASNVRFLGFLDDRLKYLPTFNTFALTSSLEGIPRCLMEAMAANTCVTAYNIPGVDQLITHGKTGLSYPLNDSSALAEGWHQLAQDHTLQQTLGKAGQAFVQENYSAQGMATHYQRLYAELLKNKVKQYA